MDYHSENNLFNNLFFNLLAVTPAASIVLLAVTLILLLISFLVSGSEVAFFSLSQKDINRLKTKQRPAYRRIISLIEQPKVLLATMTITNCLANIGIIVILNVLISSWLEQAGLHSILLFSIKLVAISFLIVIWGEVLPRVWATHHKIWFAATASLVIEIFNSVLYLFSRRIVKFGNGIERRLSSGYDAQLESANLDYAIDLLPDHEATNEEKQILKGIQKFGTTEVKQIMRTRMDVSGVEYNTKFKDLLEKVSEFHYSRIPVYKNNLDESVGLLRTKDLIPYLNEADDYDWHHVICDPIYVHEQKPIEDLMQEFRAKRSHFAIVVDEFGGTSGIVTLEDIMEEIIGEIKDEFDDEETINKKLDDYNYIFEGKMMIGDACKAMGLSIDTFDTVSGESDSVAGLVLEIAGEFPAENAEIVVGDFTLIPLSINKNRIDKVKVKIKQKN